MNNLNNRIKQKKEIIKIFSISIHFSAQTIIVALLAIAALILKFYLLFERSLYIDPDEGYYLILARNLITGNGYTFNGLNNIVFPPFLPALIALFYLFIQDFQISLIFITAISGTLLGIITYQISKKKFAPFIPALCAFLVLFIYQLNSFLPIFQTNYVRILYRGSDILNCFLIFTSIYFVVLFAEKDKYIFAFLAGGFFAFSYLTRPEGILIFMIVFLSILFLKIISLISISYKKLIMFLLIFIIISSPYIIYLKSTTGKWSLSGKISAAQEHRETLLEVIRNNNWTPFSEFHYSFDKENMEMNQAYWGFHNKLKLDEKRSIKYFLENIPQNLEMYFLIPKILFPWYVLVFFLIGFGYAAFQIVKRKSIIDIILFLLFPYSLLIVVLSYPIPRHHLFLVPVFCVYAVEGIVFVTNTFAKNKNKIKKILITSITSIIILFLANEYITNLSYNLIRFPGFRKSLSVKSYISQYLKNNGANTIMSLDPGFAVRANSDWQVMPRAAFPVIIQFAKNKNVDYVIFPNQKGNKYFYSVIDIKNSYIPKSRSDKFRYSVVKQSDFFNLINIVKKD